MALQIADQYIHDQSRESRPNAMITQLTMMGYPKDYVLRAIDVHKKSKFGSNWNLSLLVEIIVKLKQKEKSLSIFVPHFMTMDEPLRLNIGDSVDYRYENGRFILCCILDKITFNGCIIKLHPLGRSRSDTKYDKSCDIYQQYYKLATPKSISLRRIRSRNHIFYNYNVGHFIDINPIYRAGHQGWKSGKIVKLDPNSSQIKVLYHNAMDNTNYTYWFHLQNANEVAEFRTKCKALDKHQLQEEFNKDIGRSRLQSESIFDVNYVRYSVHKASNIRRIPIRDDFNKKASVSVKKNIRNKPKAIPKIKDGFGNDNGSTFDNEMRSVALGNNLMMDDIVDEMNEGGNETKKRKDSLVLRDSNSDRIESVHVMAEEEEEKEDNISFKVRHKMYDPNDNKSIDIDAIAFDDDDVKDDIMNDSTTMGHDGENEEKKDEERKMSFYIDYKSQQKQNIIAIKDDNRSIPFIQCMTLDEIDNLKESDLIDHRNPFGQFVRAIVIAKDEENKTLKIRYRGWTHQYIMESVWNGWSATDKSQQYRFAKYESISCRKSYKWAFKHLRIGSAVELRPSTSPYHEMDKNNGYYGWQSAEIFKMDHKSGQIQCKYRYNNNYYLYWTHFDNESEITYIDNCYDIGDNICVYNELAHEWMMANVLSIDINVITVDYMADHNKEQIHVRFDEAKLIFPKLIEDIKYTENAIMKEGLPWKLMRVTPTNNNTIYQCFAYLMYGDLNLAIHIKNECIRYIEHNKDNDIIMALCAVYTVRIRIFEYKMNSKRLNIVIDHGVDDLEVPIVLLSKHLNKYYNIIIDKDSVHRIPFYYH